MDEDFAIGGSIPRSELNSIYGDITRSIPGLTRNLCDAIKAAYCLHFFDNGIARKIISSLISNGISDARIRLSIDGITKFKYLDAKNIIKATIDVDFVISEMTAWSPSKPLELVKEKEQVEREKKLPSPDKFFERRGFPLSFCIWSMGLCVAEYEQVANIVKAGGREKFEKEYIPKLYDYHKFLREEWPTSLYNPDYKRERYQANPASKLSVSLLELLDLARAREAT